MRRIISLIVFAVFYVLSFCTCNFPYPEYAKYPTISFIFSLLTAISFLFVSAFFSGSKKFLIIVSACFIWLLVSIICLVSFNGDFFLWLIPFMVFALPLEHSFQPLYSLIDILNINDDYTVFICFALIVISFYMTYFISKKRRKEEIK